MNPKDRDDLTHAISQVFAFYGKELDVLQMKLWLRALANSDLTRVKQALADYTSIGRFAPKPVDILDLLKNTVTNEARALPAPERKVQEAPPEVSAAWAYVIRLWGLGDFWNAGSVDSETADRHIELVNRQCAASGNADAIPPDAWLESVWGCSRETALRRMGIAA